MSADAAAAVESRRLAVEKVVMTITDTLVLYVPEWAYEEQGAALDALDLLAGLALDSRVMPSALHDEAPAAERERED